MSGAASDEGEPKPGVRVTVIFAIIIYALVAIAVTVFATRDVLKGEPASDDRTVTAALLGTFLGILWPAAAMLAALVYLLLGIGKLSSIGLPKSH